MKPTQSGPARSMRLAHIVQHQKQFLIRPNPDESQLLFEPFRFQISNSLLHSILRLLESLYWGHGRCLGGSILVDCRTRMLRVHVPAQRVGEDAACWALTEENPASDPMVRVAATFQSRVLHTGEQAVDSAPPTPGLHLVNVMDTPREVWVFYRSRESAPGNEGVCAVPPEWVIDDSDEVSLDRILTKLTFI